MNVLQTIVQEAVSQCMKQGVATSAALSSFYIRTLLLAAEKDPQNNVELTSEQVEKLVNTAVRTLTTPDSPMLETLKLQASITTAQQEQVNAIRTEKVQHKAKGHRLIEEANAKRDPMEVFGDIVLYIMHETRCISQPPNEQVQRETMVALESVFPRHLMDSFVSQQDPEKVRQLEEIWRIVWGIRLFNKLSSKGGAGIPDLLDDAQRAIEFSYTQANALMEAMKEQSRQYAAVLGCPSLRLKDTAWLRLQDEYYNRLQLCVYSASLVNTVTELARRLEEFLPSWNSTVNDTASLVENAETSTVPKSSIYPRFIALSERWDALFSLFREAIDTKAICDILLSYRQSFQPSLYASDVERAAAGLAEERQPNRPMIAQELKNPGVDYHPELSGQDTKDSRLEFNGFCIVSFMDDGVLLPGKTDPALSPGFVFLHANSAYYAFSSERALKNFAKDPFKYLSQRLMDIVANNPVLVHLLGLQPYLPKEIYLAGTRQHEVIKKVEKGDGTTQTGHIDDFKDPHYEWNEWELRRLALKLAGLRNKRTKSVQSSSSHFRRDNDCQAYNSKDQGTQTLVDTAVQPPRVVRFIKGLRGQLTSRSETVEKTFLY